jgi:hypothetical protein
MSVADTGATSASPYLSGAGTFLSALGQFQQGQGYLEHGIVQNEAAQFAAQQLRQNADAVQGATQRTAGDIGRQAQYVMSTQMARAAASGAGASDPSVISLMARTSAMTSYKQQTVLYQGESQARQMNLQAEADIWSGQEESRIAGKASSAADLGAAATLTKGGVSLYEKYGRGGPGAPIDDQSSQPGTW